MRCDSTTEIYRDINTAVGYDFYTHIVLFPNPQNELQAITDYWRNLYPSLSDSPTGVIHNWGMKKLASVRQTGVWSVWVNGVRQEVRRCSLTIERVDEGQEVDYEKNKVPGKKIEIKKQKIADDEFESYVAELPKGYIKRLNDAYDGNPILMVLSDASQEFSIAVQTGVRLCPNNVNETFLYEGIGSNYNENYLIFHPNWLGQSVFISGEFYPAEKDLYISHFAELDGVLYACETGSGDWYRYNEDTQDATLVSAVKVKGDGILSNIVNDTGTYTSVTGSTLWAITSPDGVLGKFSKEHIMHVETLSTEVESLTNILGELAQAFNCVVDYTDDNELVFISRGISIRNHKLDEKDILFPTPNIQSALFYDTILLTYANGKVKSGTSDNTLNYDIKYVYSKAHAQILSDIYRGLNTGEEVTVEVMADFKYLPNDTVNLYFEEAGVIQTIITAVGYGVKEPVVHLTLKRKIG